MLARWLKIFNNVDYVDIEPCSNITNRFSASTAKIDKHCSSKYITTSRQNIFFEFYVWRDRQSTTLNKCDNRSNNSLWPLFSIFYYFLTIQCKYKCKNDQPPSCCFFKLMMFAMCGTVCVRKFFWALKIDAADMTSHFNFETPWYWYSNSRFKIFQCWALYYSYRYYWTKLSRCVLFKCKIISTPVKVSSCKGCLVKLATNKNGLDTAMLTIRKYVYCNSTPGQISSCINYSGTLFISAWVVGNASW